MNRDSDGIASTASAIVVAASVAATGGSGHPLESLLGAAAFTALQPVLNRGFEWVADVLKLGAARSGRQVEDLIGVLNSSPEQQELLIKAIELARSTSLKAKRKALAEALANGAVSVDSSIGETQVVRVLENLDAAHIRVLSAIGQGRDQSEMPRPGATISPFHYEPHDVAQLIANSYGSVDRLLAQLAAQGLADQRRDMEGLRPIQELWCITLYGIEMLKRLAHED